MKPCLWRSYPWRSFFKLSSVRTAIGQKMFTYRTKRVDLLPYTSMVKAYKELCPIKVTKCDQSSACPAGGHCASVMFDDIVHFLIDNVYPQESVFKFDVDQKAKLFGDLKVNCPALFSKWGTPVGIPEYASRYCLFSEQGLKHFGMSNERSCNGCQADFSLSEIHFKLSSDHSGFICMASAWCMEILFLAFQNSNLSWRKRHGLRRNSGRREYVHHLSRGKESLETILHHYGDTKGWLFVEGVQLENLDESFLDPQ